MSADVTKIRAGLEFADKTLFEVSGLVFETLVDARANSKSQCDHLTITSAERALLVKKINDGFGKSIDDTKDEPFGVASASVLRAELSFDEPWN